MSNELLKVNDLWIVWNNTCDSPETWGTRAEMWEYLNRVSQHHVCTNCGHDSLTDRFDRAEANGTSAMWYEGPPKGFVFEQVGWLPWDRVEAFFATFDPDKEEGGTPFDMTMLDPFEEEEDEDQ